MRKETSFYLLGVLVLLLTGIFCVWGYPLAQKVASPTAAPAAPAAAPADGAAIVCRGSDLLPMSNGDTLMLCLTKDLKDSWMVAVEDPTIEKPVRKCFQIDQNKRTADGMYPLAHVVKCPRGW